MRQEPPGKLQNASNLVAEIKCESKDDKKFTFHILSILRLEERHTAQMKGLSQEATDLRTQLTQIEKELQHLRTELQAQKEANVRSPSNTMKNLVERLKSQVALKEKQLKVDQLFIKIITDVCTPP